MFFDKKNRKDGKFLGTFTKKWVSLILFIALIDMQLSYILAFLGKEQIAESLSIAVATEIIGVTTGYLVKSFLETYAEEKNKLEKYKFDSEDDSENDNIADLPNEDIVG